MGMELNAEQIRYLNNNRLYVDYILNNKTLDQISKETGISRNILVARVGKYQFKKYKTKIKE